MRPDDSQYPRDWLRIAERDLLRIERALRDSDGEQAGFYLQQAVEKFLKAYLLARGWNLRRTHDLKALLDDLGQVTPAFERFRPACEIIGVYYMLERYPVTMGRSLSVDEVNQSWDAVRDLIDQIRAGTR